MSKTSFLRLLLVALVILSVTSCVGLAGLPRQTFDKERGRDLKTIGLIETGHKEVYDINIGGYTGGGLIGALAAANDMKQKTDDFTQVFNDRRIVLAREFQNSLADALRNSGYEVRIIKRERTSKPALIEDCKGLDAAGVDAYLDSFFQAGYTAASGTLPYIPDVRILVRLIKQGSDKVLYEDHVSYGYEPQIGDWFSIAADKQYSFPYFKDLMENQDKCIEGLREGIPRITTRVAQDLGK